MSDEKFEMIHLSGYTYWHNRISILFPQLGIVGKMAICGNFVNGNLSLIVHIYAYMRQ